MKFRTAEKLSLHTHNWINRK